MKRSLLTSEWFLAISLLILLFSFFLIANINARKASFSIERFSPIQEEISVTIDGAVKKPGSYSVRVGTTVGQAVRKAKPTKDANLSLLSMQEIIEAPLHLTIQPLEEIKVKVFGAVQEAVELTLPVGSRICDLKSKITLTKEAEKAFFRRKKRLKNGDQIEVPKKTVE
jgi:DNA uptake protein ComE-like DNA-binding protein